MRDRADIVIVGAGIMGLAIAYNLAKSHGIHPDVKVADDPKTKADEARERALGVLAGQVGG